MTLFYTQFTTFQTFKNTLQQLHSHGGKFISIDLLLDFVHQMEENH